MNIDTEKFRTNPLFKRKEFCDMCGITRSCLRMWMENDCLNYQRDKNNNYILYDADISFYDVYRIKVLQNIGLTLKQISNLDKIESKELIELFVQKKESIIAQIDILKKSLDDLEERISTVKRIQNFKNNTVTSVGEIPFKYIYSISYLNKKMAEDLLKDKLLACSVAFTDSFGKTEGESKKDTTAKKNVFLYGYASNTKLDHPIIWQKEDDTKCFTSTMCQKRINNLSEASEATMVPDGFINDEIIKRAPNKAYATDFDIINQPKDVAQVTKILQNMGFDLKTIITVWKINTTINGEWRTCHDIFIEYKP